MENLTANLVELIEKIGFHEYFATAIIIAVIIGLAILGNWIAKHVIVAILRRLILKSKTDLDDILIEKKVFNTLSHMVPALIIYFMIPLAFRKPDEYANVIDNIQSFTYIYMIIVVMIVINSFLNAVYDMYRMIARKRNITLEIKGYVQVVKILFILVGVIFIIAVLLDKKPGAIFAGLGALAAILLLVFKDTILGFVASIQLSAYKMLKVGDWITMPTRSADGDVIDISLSTVKVQNFDKTITTIPTYALVSESFTNWTGMQVSGGRRIMRYVNLDMNSIKFCTPEMLERFQKMFVLKDYITEKLNEIEQYNSNLREKHKIDDSINVNIRRLTNIGVFRKYIEFYLRSHMQVVHTEKIIEKQRRGRKEVETEVDKIVIDVPGKFKPNMTMLVRQLAPSEKGVAIQIYVFAATTNWVEYEGIQSDLFDHLFAVLSEFELKPFQNPSGDDFQKAIAMKNNYSGE